MMPRFAYLPLDTAREEIRLISLLPGLFNDDIQVEIFHEPLSEEHVPEHEALSYAWGLTENLDIICATHKAGLGND